MYFSGDMFRNIVQTGFVRRQLHMSVVASRVQHWHLPRHRLC